MFLCYSYMYRSKTNLQGRVYFHLASGYGLAPPMQSWLAKLTSRRLLKSLHSVYCPSHPHCSSGVIKKPVGWSTLLAPQVTLVSTRITQNSLQDAQLLPFSSQGYRTWQRIQIISCFRPIEWNKNARVDLLIVFIYKVCKTWQSHFPFSFPCCLLDVCPPWSRKIVQYILIYLNSSKCFTRQKLRTGMKIWQSKLWNHHLWSQTLMCSSCPWAWAAHHDSSGQQWRFPSGIHRYKEMLLSRERPAIDLPGSSYQV